MSGSIVIDSQSLKEQLQEYEKTAEMTEDGARNIDQDVNSTVNKFSYAGKDNSSCSFGL